LASDIEKKLDANVCSFGHFALMLSLHSIVKCRSRSLTIDNSDYSYWVVHASAQKIIETTQSLKICYFLFILKL